MINGSLQQQVGKPNIRRQRLWVSGHWRSLIGKVGTLVAWAALATGPVWADDGLPPRLNVLFICIDDLRPELGCYGVPEAQTPCLDRLASQGVLFTQHFVQVPTCGASRYALLTGRAPWRSGVRRGNEAFFGGETALRTGDDLAAASMPELFRRNGYRTVCVGKVSHTPDGRVFAYNGSGDGRPEVPGGWDALPTPFGPWERGWGIFFAYANGHHREDGQGYQDLTEFQVERDEDLPDGLLAQTAIEQLQDLADRDEPFFLGLGFFKPHLPFVAPREDWEAMAEAPLTLGDHRERPDTVYWHRSGEFFRYDAPFDKHQPLDPAATALARRAYYACVRYTDRQVGKVLDALDRLGLAESTVVVVWGDHGWHLGESSLWGKHSPHERALRSTLLMRVPGSPRHGEQESALVETLDLFPTLVDLCDLPETATQFPLDGESLVPLLEGHGGVTKKIALSTWGQDLSIRSETHRLIVRRRDEGWQQPELYAMDVGPDPEHNLAEDQPERVQALLELAEARLASGAAPDAAAPETELNPVP